MQAITQNAVTQGKHGVYNAVDYAANPDPTAYAPEDVTFISYTPNNGDCGNSLKVRGATGEHGFCHLEESYIKSGQSKKRGEPLFKMGYTGLTVPAGPNGRHAHQVLNKGGVWVYPPSQVNETFKKEGDGMAWVEDYVLEDYKKNKEIRFLLEKERDEVLYPFVTDVTKALGIPNSADKGLAQTAVQQLRDKADSGDTEAAEKIKQIKEILG